tara:strand:- start:7763 stop:7927 length:165 start_codon:yes stop_codon:yes gene_type:complete
MLNLRIEAASVFGHRSTDQISKEFNVAGIIADNQIKIKGMSKAMHVKSDFKKKI